LKIVAVAAENIFILSQTHSCVWFLNITAAKLLQTAYPAPFLIPKCKYQSIASKVIMFAFWLSGNELVSINKVSLCWACLHWDWRLSLSRQTTSACNQPPRSNQPDHHFVGRQSECQYTTRCISPGSIVSQHKLLSGWGLQNWRSVQPYGPVWLRKDFTFCTYNVNMNR